MSRGALASSAAILSQLLMAGASGAGLELPPGQLGHLLESLVEPRKPWFNEGLLGPLQICSGDPRPPLWIARRNGRTVYLAAASSLPATALEPAYAPVKQALGCADVAYFELPCSAADPASQAGKYLGHCLKYPTYTPLASVKSRLPAGELEALRSAVLKLADEARWSCAPAMSRLKTVAAALNVTSLRTTLLALYQGILAALSPKGCDASNLDFGETHAEWLRREFGTRRPSFGLEDVGMQCDAYEGDTVEQDKLLARSMTAELSRGNWFQSKMDRHKIVADAMKCGSLQHLADKEGALSDLHWLRQRLLAKRNSVFARGIERALDQQPGKTIAAVIGLAHFVDMNGTSSIVTLLREAGFVIQQAGGDQDLGCPRAKPAPPVAEQPGRCLQPVDRAQPASCTDFHIAFKKAIAQDAMYGRSKTSTNCKACADSNLTCSCEVKWTNASGFKELCMGTVVDGIRGQVLAMDLVRNPGSVRAGSGEAEKTVRGLYQNCYAESCSVPLLEEMALRSWYAKDPTLAEGVVALRRPEEPSAFAGGAAPTDGSLGWPLWAWALSLPAAALAIWCLVACFRCRGPRKRGRGAALALPGAHEGPAAVAAAAPPPAATWAGAGAWAGAWQHAAAPAYPTLLERYAGPAAEVARLQELPLLPGDRVSKLSQFAGPVGPPPQPQPLLARPAAPPVPGGASFGGSFRVGSSYGNGPAREPLPARQSFAREPLAQASPAVPRYAGLPAGRVARAAAAGEAPALEAAAAAAGATPTRAEAPMRADSPAPPTAPPPDAAAPLAAAVAATPVEPVSAPAGRRLVKVV